jgi:Cache domain
MKAKKRGSVSLVTRMVATIIGAVAASVLATGGMLTWLSFRSQMSELRFAQRSVAEVASERIGAYIDDLQRKLNYLARVRGLSTFGEDPTRSLLEGLIYSNKAYESVGITDGSGSLRYSLSPGGEASPRDWGSAPAFRRAYVGQEDYVGPVEAGPGGGPPSLLLSVPIRDREERVDGMLFARVGLKYLSEALAETRVGESGYAYIVDQRGLVIARAGTRPSPRGFEDLSRRDMGGSWIPANPRAPGHTAGSWGRRYSACRYACRPSTGGSSSSRLRSKPTRPCFARSPSWRPACRPGSSSPPFSGFGWRGGLPFPFGCSLRPRPA